MEKFVALAAVWVGKKITFYAIGKVYFFIYYYIISYALYLTLFNLNILGVCSFEINCL